MTLTGTTEVVEEMEPGDAPRADAFSFWFWPVAAALVLTVLSLGDLLLGSVRPRLDVLLWTIAVSLCTGALHGAFFGGVFRLLLRKSRLVQGLIWGLLAAAGVAFEIYELGVLSRLRGEYSTLAILTLAACIVAGAFATVFMVLIQPLSGRPRGWLGEKGPGVRSVLGSLLLLGAGAMIAVDRNFYEGGYVSAHVCLRVCAFWSVLFAAVLVMTKQRLTTTFPAMTARWGRACLGFLLASFVITSLTLGQEDEAALQAMLAEPYPALSLETLRGLSDIDADGYSALFGGGDCRALHRSVHPSAAEVPGNGVDDNCQRGDASTQIDTIAQMKWPVDEAETSVVLVTIDTLSAPYMSLYGNPHQTTPRLDEWAKDAAVFERAYTSGGWTSLAISSLFRGVYPRKLRWTRLYETTDWRLLRREELKTLREDEQLKMMFGLPLDDPRVPLPVWLSFRGLHTAAVVNDAQSEFLDPKFQGRGFDSYKDMDETHERAHATDKDVTQEAIATLRKMPAKKPFFLWVHYFGPHLGNSSHGGIPKFAGDQVGKYEHEIAYLDQQLAVLLKHLNAVGKKRSLHVIVTSDHGEIVSKTGRGHGRDLLEDGIRVPLLIKGPSYKKGRYSPAVSIVDIYPTVLALTSSPMPNHIDGVDLARVVRGEESVKNRALISETWRYDREGRLRTEFVAAFNGRLKLTLDTRTRSRSLREQVLPEDLKQNLMPTGRYDFSALTDKLESHLEHAGSPRFER